MSAAELYVEHGRWVVTVRLLPGTPLEAAWETVYQPPDLVLPTPELSWTNVRTSGVLLLLGVGTLVCYRLYTRCAGAGGDGDGGASDGDAGGWRHLLRRLLGVATWRPPAETIERADDLHPDDDIQVHYFGPSEYYGPPLAPSARAPARTRVDSVSSSGDSAADDDDDAEADADSLPYLGDNSASVSVGDPYRTDDEAECSSLEPDMGNKPAKHYEPVFYNKDAGVIFNRLQAERLATGGDTAGTAAGGGEPPSVPLNSAGGAANLTASPERAAPPPLAAPALRPIRKRVILPHGARAAAAAAGGTTSLSSAESSQSASASPRARSLPPASPGRATGARQHTLRRQLQEAHTRGGSVDLSVAELCQMYRDGSIDSSTSDLSVDLAWADSLGAGTADFLDQLQSQLDVLKLDVTDMDSSLVTLHFPHRPGGGAAGARRPVLGHSTSEYGLGAGGGDCSLSVAAGGGGGGGAPADWRLESSATDASLEWDSPEHGWSAVPRGGGGGGAPLSSLGRPPTGARGPPLSRSQSAASSLRRSPSLDLRSEDMPSLEWDDTGVEQYPEVWTEHVGPVSTGLGDDVAELDLELELQSSRDSASIRSVDSARAPAVGGDREASVESSASTVQDYSSASRHNSLTLALSGEDSSAAAAADPLSESGYEGMDGSSLLLRTPLSPLPETPADRCLVSSDSALSADPGLDGDAPSFQFPAASGVSPRERRSNRDSAYWDDGLDTLAARAHEAVSDAMDLLDYAHQEWRGTTPRARAIRQGYEEMAGTYGLTRIHRVRGDNYCAVRAALYQALSAGVVPPPAARCQERLVGAGHWVRRWSFGSRLPYDEASALQGIRDCLSTLSRLSEELQSVGVSSAGRQLRDRWNADPDLDLRCMEAVKLHMLAAAVELEQCRDRDETPLFATLLFARDTSATARDLMLNHLNHVGDSGGLEQIEMFLLGHTLDVTLRVIRPSAHAQCDFVTYYPEQASDGRPQLTLVAEDDRHYNVAS